MLLINPAKERFGGFLARYVPVGLPMAIGSLAGYLRAHDVDVRLHDEELFPLSQGMMRELLEDLPSPRVVGLTCLTAHVERVVELAEMIKGITPDAAVVVGGVHATAMPAEALETRVIDYVISGEGEEALLQLHRALAGAGDPREVPGVSFLDGDKTIHNQRPPLIESLDSIPRFPYDLFPDERYFSGNLMTARGCPYRCSYCSQRTMTGSSYRHESTERVMGTLDLQFNHRGQRMLGFYDDNFCCKPSRVVDLCNAILDSDLAGRCKFGAQARADSFLRDKDLAPLMAEAGFCVIGFGLETAVERLSNKVNKGESLEQHLDAIEVARKHGMSVSLFMMFGLPTETAADRRTSYHTVQKTKVLTSKYNNLVPYPGTPLHEELRGNQRMHIEPDWSNFNSTLSVTRSIFDKTPLAYVPETTSEFELKRDIVRYNILTYLQPKTLWSLLGSSDETDWYRLPKRWYLDPHELLELTKIGTKVMVNMAVAFLPLRLTEPIMNALNPMMKRRPRVVASEEPASDQQSS